MKIKFEDLLNNMDLEEEEEEDEGKSEWEEMDFTNYSKTKRKFAKIMKERLEKNNIEITKVAKKTIDTFSSLVAKLVCETYQFDRKNKTTFVQWMWNMSLITIDTFIYTLLTKKTDNQIYR